MTYNNFNTFLNDVYNEIKYLEKPILLKYTEKISCDLNQIANNISNELKIIYMHFPNKKCYLGIEDSISLKANSKKELNNLKNNTYKIISNTNNKLLFFGGASFNLEKEMTSIWKDVPKSNFIVPKILISKNNNKTKLTYIKKINKNTTKQSILKEFAYYVNIINNKKIKAEKYVIPDIKPILEKPTYQQYINNINKIINDIKYSSLEKVVISRISQYSLTKKISISNLMSYLNKNHPNCFNYIISFDKNKYFIGSTPEKIIQLNNLSFNIDAIAGSSSNEKDIQNNKEIEEHNFVTKYIKKKMESISSKLIIPTKPKILNLNYIYHLYTEVSGKTKNAQHVLDLLIKLYPTPALLGKPYKDALEKVDKYETFNRGWYGGCIGLYDEKGNGEFYVPIRSGLIKNKNIYLYTGSGIVLKSRAEKEWKETELKLQHLLSYFNKN